MAAWPSATIRPVGGADHSENPLFPKIGARSTSEQDEALWSAADKSRRACLRLGLTTLPRLPPRGRSSECRKPLEQYQLTARGDTLGDNDLAAIRVKTDNVDAQL